MPEHLWYPVGEWLRTRFGWHSSQGMRHDFMAQVASALRIPVTQTHAIGGVSDQIFAAIERDEDLYLDCVDVALFLAGGGASNLRQALNTGGSVWTVREDERGLERRVPQAAAQSYQLAIASRDAVAGGAAPGLGGRLWPKPRSI